MNKKNFKSISRNVYTIMCVCSLMKPCFFVREKILTGQESENHLKYLTSLVDLLATCAEVS